MIIKPPMLMLDDVIGIVSPSYFLTTDKTSIYYQNYIKGQQELNQMGFKIKEGRNLGKKFWWSGGTPQERAEDINEMYGDPEVKAIIAQDGGNDCIAVLEYLDFKLIENNPKPFIGFSNITNIHSALFTKIGLVGFHMGLLTYELGNYWQQADKEVKTLGKEYFRSVLSDINAIGRIKPISEWESWKSGKVSGQLFGGNLSMLDSLIGTDYFPSLEQLKGSILFWEIDNSPSYRIERVLTHFKYYGVFDVIAGMLIGKLVDIKPTLADEYEPAHKEIVLKILENYSFPILANMDFGHKMVQIPMPIGINVTMDAGLKELFFNESTVI